MATMLASVMKQICASNGAKLYDDLVSDFRSGLCGSWYNSSFDRVFEGNESLVTVFVNGQKTVIAKTGVKLCRAKNCDGCMNLHLCKFHLFGDCQYGRGR